MTILAAVVVFARLFARIKVKKNAGVDDAFISAALLFSIATTVTMILQGIHRLAELLDKGELTFSISEMGHGPPHRNALTSRRHRVSESLLHQHLGIQPGHVLHQILDSASISAYLPASALPQSLLCHDGNRGNLLVLDLL